MIKTIQQQEKNIRFWVRCKVLHTGLKQRETNYRRTTEIVMQPGVEYRVLA